VGRRRTPATKALEDWRRWGYGGSTELEIGILQTPKGGEGEHALSAAEKGLIKAGDRGFVLVLAARFRLPLLPRPTEYLNPKVLLTDQSGQFCDRRSKKSVASQARRYKLKLMLEKSYWFIQSSEERSGCKITPFISPPLFPMPTL
jgi:hypothetical protein